MRLERRHHGRAFSLIEIVLVIAIVGVVSGIAIPRLTSTAEHSKQKSVVATARVYQRAIDHYAAEHLGLHPANLPDGSVDTDGVTFVKRLLVNTNEQGGFTPPEIYGPYLRAAPVNPMNGLSSVRIDGAASGANTHGWRFDPANARIVPDDAKGGDEMVSNGGTTFVIN